jgi:proliferating cell nuclear antigen
MKCVFERGELFKHIIDSIKDLCPHTNLDFSASGLALQSMDNAHVSLASLLMKREGFKSYECEVPISLGVSLNTLSLVLRGATGPLEIESRGDTLKLNVSKLDGKAEYVLKLMEIDTEGLGIPDSQCSAVATLPSKTYARVVKDFGDLSETCVIRMDDNMHISIKGEIGNAVWHGGEECTCRLLTDEPFELRFSMRYLCFFSKAASISPKVVIGMTNDMPICVTYPVDGGGFLRFYLAPQIEDDI